MRDLMCTHAPGYAHVAAAAWHDSGSTPKMPLYHPTVDSVEGGWILRLHEIYDPVLRELGACGTKITYLAVSL